MIKQARKPPETGGWFWCHNQTIDISKESGPTCFAVYFCLVRMSDEFGECFPAYDKIGEKLGLSESTAKRSVTTLRKHGWVESVFRKGKSNIYRICTPPKSPMTQVTDDLRHTQPRSPVAGVNGHLCPTTQVTDDLLTRPTNKTHLTRRRRNSSFEESEDSEGFRRFYEVYPRHEKRGDAEKLFSGAIRTVMEEAAGKCGPKNRQQAIDYLVSAAELYARRVSGKDQQYIRLPSTWLKSKSWSDETRDSTTTETYERATPPVPMTTTTSPVPTTEIAS